MSDITLYRSIASRSITALWMLEELGLAYRMETFDVAKGETRSAAYLALNPHGAVPMIVDGDVKVTEAPAICLYLADRYGMGSLAPRLDEAARGPYLSWTVWATAVLEPASTLGGLKIEVRRGNWGFGFVDLDETLTVLKGALAESDYLAGGRFTAADVMVGAVIAMRLHTGQLPREDWLVAYHDRLAARAAFGKAMAINWPPDLFGRA